MIFWCGVPNLSTVRAIYVPVTEEHHIKQQCIPPHHANTVGGIRSISPGAIREPTLDLIYKRGVPPDSPFTDGPNPYPDPDPDPKISTDIL